MRLLRLPEQDVGGLCVTSYCIERDFPKKTKGIVDKGGYSVWE